MLYIHIDARNYNERHQDLKLFELKRKSVITLRILRIRISSHLPMLISRAVAVVCGSSYLTPQWKTRHRSRTSRYRRNIVCVSIISVKVCRTEHQKSKESCKTIWTDFCSWTSLGFFTKTLNFILIKSFLRAGTISSLS